MGACRQAGADKYGLGGVEEGRAGRQGQTSMAWVGWGAVGAFLLAGAVDPEWLAGAVDPEWTMFTSWEGGVIRNALVLLTIILYVAAVGAMVCREAVVARGGRCAGVPVTGC